MGIFGDLFEATGFSDLLTVGVWRTLSNGRRAKLDSEGRIVAGLPSKYHGTHVRDLAELSRKERALEATDCDSSTKCHRCPTTFPSKAHAVAALVRR